MIGILQRQAPELVFPQESIGQYQFSMYAREDDDWLYTGLSSLYNRTIGIRMDASYGIFDSFIRRYGDSNRQLQLLNGSDITNRLLIMLESNRINMFLEDKNIINYLENKNESVKINKAGSIPPDNVYVAFRNNNAQKFADIFSKGVIELRNNNLLDPILHRYGVSDWKNCKADSFDPFAGNYIARLKDKYSNEKNEKINEAVAIFESSVKEGSGYWKYAIRFKELLEQYSDGKLKVDLRFGNTSEHDIAMKLSEGKTHMGMIATNNIAPFAPSLGFFTLPYMFPEMDDAKTLLRHEKMEEIALRSALESNVRPLSFFIGGYRILANNVRVVKTTQDLKGLKIRVPQNQMMLETFRAWGIEAYPIPWSEVYPSLEAGLIDGQENPVNILFAGINMTKEAWEVLKYLTNIHYFLFTAPHLISESFYQGLTRENQEFVRKAAIKAEEYIWDTVAGEDQKLTEFAKTKGMVFVDPENETGDWEAKARSIWPKFYFRTGGKDLIDSIQNIIDQ